MTKKKTIALRFNMESEWERELYEYFIALTKRAKRNGYTRLRYLYDKLQNDIKEVLNESVKAERRNVENF